MNGASAGRRLRLLHAGPLPPPFTGINVSLEQLLASAPLRTQATWVLDTSARTLPGDPRKPKLPSPRRLVRHADLAARTARLVRARRIDVLHLHGSSHDLSLFGNGLSILAARAAGARTVWHLHDDLGVVAFPGRRRLTQRSFASVMRLPDAVALLSHKDRAIASAFVDPRRTAVLPPTCNPELATLPLERPANGAISVLFAGWLTEAKGIFDLVRVAATLGQTQPAITFDVLGTGMSPEETAAVRAAVEQYGVAARVRLHGVVTGAAKQAMFARAHLLFLPTHWDAFPVVILEAMAAGLPVLATRVGGVPLLVDDECGGLLAEVGDIAGLSERVLRLARDPCLRLAMGRANRQRFMTSYHPDAVGQVALDLYRRVVGARS